MHEKFQSNCKIMVVLKKTKGFKASVHGAKMVTVAATIGPTSVTIMCGANGRLAKTRGNCGSGVGIDSDTLYMI